MPSIFDNIEKSLADALRSTLAQASKADFCVGYFNLRGWGKLSDLVAARFDGQDESCVRILVGMTRPPEEEMKLAQAATRQPEGLDGPTLARLKTKTAEVFKQQIEFGLPSAQAERSLQELARQIKAGQVKVKAFLRYSLHAKLYLIHRQDDVTPLIGYMGSSNLTQSGLSGNGELNVDVVEQDAANKLLKWFNDRWDDSAAFDISADLVKLIETSWAREELVLPYLVYLKMIYHLSADARTGQKEFKLPREFENVLLDFQAEAVKLAARHMHRRGGVLLGDVVGLGKTVMASAVAKIFELDEGGRTLILCPPKLKSMWDGYVQRYNLNADVRSIGIVVDGLSELRGRYMQVIIDESHNLRNREGQRYQAVQSFIDEHGARCLLLTATPYNKEYKDISNQLRLFWDENKEIGMRPERFFQDWTDNGYNDADFRARYQTSTRSLRAFEQSEYPDDWRNLLRLFMVRRTRSFITANYAKYDEERQRYYVTIQGRSRFFPLRNPEKLSFALDEDDPNDQYARLYRDDVVDVIHHLELPRYGLAQPRYLHQNIQAFSPTADEKRILDNLGRAGKRLIGFSRTNLFKRLESSGHSFLLSLQRHILRNLITCYALENDLPIPIGTQDVGALDTAILDTQAEWLPDDDPATDETDVEDTFLPDDTDPLDRYRQQAEKVYQLYREQYRSRFQWLSPRFFKKELQTDLVDDARDLMQLVDRAGAWDPSRDAKLDELFDLLTVQHPDEKVLVFTQFADTAIYLTEQLRDREVTGLEAATSLSADPTRLAQRFSPKSNEYSFKNGEEELRILVTTDVLAEGQNLQDCAIVVNFDLPWAIIRLIQRAGRVDRIGQESDTIRVYSFWPADGVERVIRLRTRLTQRLEHNQEVVGSDESFFGENSASKLRNIYTEKTGSLDDDEDEDVDLASVAYGIWNSAPEDARKQAEKLPPVIFATKAYETTPNDPDGVLVYLQFPGGEEGLVRVDGEGRVVSQSMTTILNTAACPPETPALPRREDHYELVEAAVQKALAEVNELGGQLGSLRSTSRKLYERMDIYRQSLARHGENIPELDQALGAIYNNPFTDRARESLGRQMRLGISDADLAKMVIEWYLDERLVRVIAETETTEPVIICSMGLRGDKQLEAAA